MKARLIKKKKMVELTGRIEEDLEIYRAGNFDYLKKDFSTYTETRHEIDPQRLSEIACEVDEHREVQNCIAIHQAMGNLSYYLARDERLWVYLVLTDLLDYARARWPIPADDDKAVAHIRSHFFVSGGLRGIERDNAASRLWWMASLCNRIQEIPLEQSLQCLLYQYDVRANILERPTVSQCVPIFSALVKKLHESFMGDKALFERQKFRNFIKKVNMIGGVQLLEALDENEINRILDECIRTA